MSVTRLPSVDDGLRETLGDAASILLVGGDTPETEAVCSELLSVTSPEETRLLNVTFDDSPDERLDVYRANVGELPAEAGVIAVGEPTRSAAAQGASINGPSPGRVTVDTVADPSDLTGLAMVIGAYLDAWDGTEAKPVVCFHSITSLLFHADEARIYRFLHSTTGRLRDVGAVAHYHLDPAAFDESTVNRFSALFDAVLEVDEDGSVTVKRRT